MSLNLQEKQIIINEVNTIAKTALSAVIADFRGITVNKITKLRKSCRESGVYMRVIRNTLISKSIINTPFECLKDVFVGPTLVAFSTKHPSTAARLLKDFAKENDSFQIKLAVFECKLIPASKIDDLASLPTYEEAIKNLIMLIKNISIGRLISSLIALK